MAGAADLPRVVDRSGADASVTKHFGRGAGRKQSFPEQEAAGTNDCVHAMTATLQEEVVRGQHLANHVLLRCYRPRDRRGALSERHVLIVIVHIVIAVVVLRFANVFAYIATNGLLDMVLSHATHAKAPSPK